MSIKYHFSEFGHDREPIPNSTRCARCARLEQERRAMLNHGLTPHGVMVSPAQYEAVHAFNRLMRTKRRDKFLAMFMEQRPEGEPMDSQHLAFAYYFVNTAAVEHLQKLLACDRSGNNAAWLVFLAKVL